MLKKILIKEVYLPIIYIIISFIIYAILCKIVDKVLVINKKDKIKKEVQKKREQTIINLFKSIIKYIIAIFCLLAILNVYGVKTTSIIASLGVAGAIIGLAFQDTIKNLLASIVIIFDNHYMQGDIVTINGFRGEVIELGLQTTKIRTYTGEVLIINNSMITSVINHSMFDTVLYIDFPVSKDVSLKTLEKIINNINKKMITSKDVTDDIKMLGIEKLNANNYIFKIEIDCKPDSHFQVNRDFFGYLKEEYDKNKITVPGEYFEISNNK